MEIIKVRGFIEKYHRSKGVERKMKTIKITTPENIEIEYRLAGLGSRVGAAILDLLIQYLIALVILFTITSFHINPMGLIGKHGGWVIGGFIIIIWLVIYGYFIIFEMSMNGMTPGKKLFKLRTIRTNGQPITIKHSIIRNLFRIIIDSYGIGIILMFFSKMHKRVGDYVGSTIVIAQEKKVLPMSLEIDLNKKDNCKYSITQGEYRLLKEYLQRRDELGENRVRLEKKLGEYFTEKFKVSKSQNEYEIFLKELLLQGIVHK